MATATAKAAEHGHEAEHEHHGLGHVASKKVLLGTGISLLCLTLLTVMASWVDFGSSQASLVVAMLIASVKASLVAMFFMHLRYDKPFHTIVIIGGLLAALLFVGFTFMDGNQYQTDVCAHRGQDCVIWHQAIKNVDTENAKIEAEDKAAKKEGAAAPAPAAPEGAAAPAPAAPEGAAAPAPAAPEGAAAPAPAAPEGAAAPAPAAPEGAAAPAPAAPEGAAAPATPTPAPAAPAKAATPAH